LDTNRLANRSKDSIVYAYEDAAIDERLEALGKVVDRGERARLLREIGDQKFFEFTDIPIYWLFAEAAVNPKYIAEYVFPGIITGFFTHPAALDCLRRVPDRGAAGPQRRLAVELLQRPLSRR
jgi:hypothetical protein